MLQGHYIHSPHAFHKWRRCAATREAAARTRRVPSRACRTRASSARAWPPGCPSSGALCPCARSAGLPMLLAPRLRPSLWASPPGCCTASCRSASLSLPCTSGRLPLHGVLIHSRAVVVRLRLRQREQTVNWPCLCSWCPCAAIEACMLELASDSVGGAMRARSGGSGTRYCLSSQSAASMIARRFAIKKVIASAWLVSRAPFESTARSAAASAPASASKLPR